MQIVMDIPYVDKRGKKGRLVYSRKVPAAIADQFGKKFIRINLNANTLKEAKIEAGALAKKHDAIFSFLKGESTALDAGSAQMALDLANPDSWKIEGVDGEMKKELMHTALLQKAEEENDVVAKKAADMIAAESPMLSLAVDAWREWKNDTLNPKGERQMLQSVKHLIAAVGEKPISEYTKADAVAMMRYCLNVRGMKPSSAQRYLNNISSLMNRSINAYTLDMSNPFSNMDLPKQAPDDDAVYELTDEQVKAIVAEAQRLMTPTAIICLIMISTTATVGEVAGLKVAHVFDRENIPFIRIEQHEARTLKTRVRGRDIPISGQALEAVRYQLAQLKGQEYLFPTYYDPKKNIIKNESASAALNKMLKKVLGFGHSHVLRRHGINKMRQANISREIIMSISGHAHGDENERSYMRSQVPLELKAKAVAKIAV